MVTSRLHDILYGMRIVQAYGGEEYERQRLREATTRHFRESMGRERLRRLIGPLNETAGVLVISALLAAAGEGYSVANGYNRKISSGFSFSSSGYLPRWSTLEKCRMTFESPREQRHAYLM